MVEGRGVQLPYLSYIEEPAGRKPPYENQQHTIKKIQKPWNKNTIL